MLESVNDVGMSNTPARLGIQATADVEEERVYEEAS